ncbi:MAG: sugar phosphate isomerase/epimerase family protein [Terriglobales bacterium]
MHRRDFVRVGLKLGGVALMAPRAISEPVAAVPDAATPAGPRSARLLAGICCYSYRAALTARTMTYEDIIRQAAEIGLDTVDLTVYWLPEDAGYLRRQRQFAYRNAIHWSGLAARTSFTAVTADGRAREMQDARRWVDLTGAMGASHLGIFGGVLPPGRREEDVIPQVVEGMAQLAEYAGGQGITLGIENDFGVTTTADQVLHYVQAVHSPWLGINDDCFNYPRDSYASFERCLPYATHIHLKSQVHDAAGQVQPADWPRLFAMMQHAGYRGSVSLEYEAAADPAMEIPRLARTLVTMVREFNRTQQG